MAMFPLLGNHGLFLQDGASPAAFRCTHRVRADRFNCECGRKNPVAYNPFLYRQMCLGCSQGSSRVTSTFITAGL